MCYVSMLKEHIPTPLMLWIRKLYKFRKVFLNKDVCEDLEKQLRKVFVLPQIYLEKTIEKLALAPMTLRTPIKTQ